MRAVIYNRISRDRNSDGAAVERQNKKAVALAKSRGWTVVNTYTDNGLSATSKAVRRPHYEAMRSAYERGEFDALICYDLDRLTRQPRQLEDWVDAAEGRGLAIVTLNGEADLTTDGGRMFARVKVAVARAEVERKGQRQRDAYEQRAAQGMAHSARRLTGYAADGSVDEAEAAFVRSLFEGFANGETVIGLARKHGRGPSSIRKMLTNPRYCGRRIYSVKGTDGKVTTTTTIGTWTPLVSEALFDRVNRRLADPARVNNVSKSTARKHLGSGLYVCADCGVRLLARGAKGRIGCPSCGMTRGMAHIDELVLGVLWARLTAPDGLALAERDPDLDPLRERVLALQEARKRVLGMLAKGLTDEAEAEAALREVKAELDTLNAAIAKADGPTLALTAEEAAGGLDSTTLDRRRALLEGLMTVTVHRAPNGVRKFDPATVITEWKTARA